MSAESWRSAVSVLVSDAQTLGAIAVIRSLGRAGYCVHAVADHFDALGLRSRFASSRAITPPHGSPEFVPWLRAYTVEHRIAAIVPSESFLLAIRDDIAEFISFLTMSRDPQRIYAGLSKYDLFRSFHGDPALQANLPPTLLVDEGSPAPSAGALAALGLPIFVKTDTTYARSAAKGSVVRCTSVDEGQRTIAELRETFRALVVQGYVPGTGVGAFFAIWDGRVLGEFAHLRLHEVPHTGGYSSYRRSLQHDAIVRDARRRLEALCWNGPAMMEYRFDPAAGRFALVEFNGRFWGSLHLPIYAGVDFPTLLVDAVLGHPVEEPVRAALDLACRYTVPGEVQWLSSRLKDPAVTWTGKLRTVADFLGLCLHPNVRSDLLFPGDRGLYWDQLAQYAGLVYRRLRRCR